MYRDAVDNELRRPLECHIFILKGIPPEFDGSNDFFTSKLHDNCSLECLVYQVAITRFHSCMVATHPIHPIQ